MNRKRLQISAVLSLVVKPPASFRRESLFTLGLTVLAALGTWTLFESVAWSQVPPELVGKWVVVGGQLDGATLDFHDNGTMAGHIMTNGNKAILNATIRVDGKKIYSTTQNPLTGKSERALVVIQTLTANELVVVEPSGKTITMKRAK